MVRGSPPASGTVTAPNLAIWSPEKGWVVENEGVAPDVDVEQTPADVIAGKDPQLERAIVEIMAKLKQPVKLPPKPAGPVKTINKRETSKATEQGNN